MMILQVFILFICDLGLLFNLYFDLYRIFFYYIVGDVNALIDVELSSLIDVESIPGLYLIACYIVEHA